MSVFRALPGRKALQEISHAVIPLIMTATDSRTIMIRHAFRLIQTVTVSLMMEILAVLPVTTPVEGETPRTVMITA
jgi:hypothetical protein